MRRGNNNREGILREGILIAFACATLVTGCNAGSTTSGLPPVASTPDTTLGPLGAPQTSGNATPAQTREAVSPNIAAPASALQAGLTVVQDDASLPCVNNSKAATLTCALPADTTVGNVLVVAVQAHNDAGQTITPPAEFKRISTQTDGIYSLMQTFTAAVQTPARSYSFHFARPNYASAMLIEVAGADRVKPVAASITAVNGAKTIVTGSLKPATPGSLPVAFFGLPSGLQTFTPKSGWTARADNGSAVREASSAQSGALTTNTTTAIQGSVSYNNPGQGVSALLLIAPSTVAATPAPSGTPNSAAADAFVNMLGVNVHFSYGNTVYKYLTSPAPSGNTVIGALKSLGIRHIRDGAIDGHPELCAAYRSTIANGTDVDNVVNKSTTATNLKTIASCLGSGLFALEAPNELDLSGTANWPTVDVNEMQLLHAARGSAYPSSVKLFGPSATSEQAYKSLAAVNGDALGGYLDDANAHVYFSARQPETTGWGGADQYGVYGDIRTTRNWAVEIASPGKPWVATETGYPDVSSEGGYVSAAVKAKYTVRDMFRHWQDGARYVYIYELAQENGSWGLMDQNLNPKPAYRALKNVIAILKDPGSAVTPGYLNYTLTANADVEHLLFRKRDGSYWLCLWQSDQGWDPNRSTPISVAATTASIHFGSAPGALQRYQLNPGDGSITSSAISPSSSVTIPVTDAPEIIQIGATSTKPVLDAVVP